MRSAAIGSKSARKNISLALLLLSRSSQHFIIHKESQPPILSSVIENMIASYEALKLNGSQMPLDHKTQIFKNVHCLYWHTVHTVGG